MTDQKPITVPITEESEQAILDALNDIDGPVPVKLDHGTDDGVWLAEVWGTEQPNGNITSYLRRS